MKMSLEKREECALCDYVIEGLKMRGSEMSNEERHGRVVRGICFPLEK